MSPTAMRASSLRRPPGEADRQQGAVALTWEVVRDRRGRLSPNLSHYTAATTRNFLIHH